MYIKRHLSPLLVYLFTWRLILISLTTGIIAYLVYQYLDWKWVAIPWLPVSLIGTATAFYVGFKNNQSYDRGWEARKIWGSITNLSRAFASSVKAYVSNDFKAEPVPQEQLDREIHSLVYRHIGWLYVLKHSMDQRTAWEHEDIASKRQRRNLHKNREPYEAEIERYLSREDIAWIGHRKNAAAQLLDRQSQHLARLRREGLLDDFRHMDLQQFITNLYAEQGGSERIKNTPFPRQYATSSTIFIVIFMILLPFGMISEFLKLGDSMLWLLIPFNVIVTWVFALMEYTGDISENPFEGLICDVPLRHIVRNIEIDLRDMLEHTGLPEKVPPVYGILY